MCIMRMCIDFYVFSVFKSFFFNVYICVMCYVSVSVYLVAGVSVYILGGSLPVTELHVHCVVIWTWRRCLMRLVKSDVTWT